MLIQVAIVGAECTGKTTLAEAVVQTLNNSVDPWSVAPEVLRLWCAEHSRTPLAHEQMAIAHAQAARLNTLKQLGVSVVADTTPLMTAIYSDVLFQDTSLYAFALEHHRSYNLTLLTAPDLPWEADGHQRDGLQARAHINMKLRSVLEDYRLPYTVVCGKGHARTQSALDTIAYYRKHPTARSAHDTTWRWPCDTCADAECEHRLFSRLF